MYIQWLGYSCMKLVGQQREATVLIDPYGPAVGQKLSRQQADIVLVSTPHEDYSNTEVVKRENEGPFIIYGAGEYEVHGVFVYGIDIKQPSEKGSVASTTVYALNVDDLYVGYLGALNRTLTEKELDALGRIDVLVVPVGGNGVLNAKTAIEVINQVEPRMIIPVHYEMKGIDRPLDSLDAFVKLYGTPVSEVGDKIKLMKKDLPVEETKLVSLNPV